MVEKVDLIAPKYYNMASDIERHAEKNKVALYWENEEGATRTLTYKDLNEQSNKLANAFKELGLTKGDKIIITLPRIPETYIAYLAALKSGLVISPGTEQLMPKDLLYRMEHSQAKAVVYYHSLTERIDEIRSEAQHVKHFISVGGSVDGWDSYDDLINGMSSQFEIVETRSNETAFLNYTSGTTGTPKGVIHSHEWAYAYQAAAAKYWLDVREDDVVWSTVGPGWSKWKHNAFLAILSAGATGLSYMGKFDAVKHLELLQKYNVNVLCSSATEYRLISKVDNLADYQLPHLRSVVSAGEPLNAHVVDTFQKHFNLKTRDGYGSTETTLLVGTLTDMPVKAGSMGKPVPGFKVEIHDEDGNPVQPGQIGEIAVHTSCPTLFKGYLNDPIRTEAAFRDDWYYTGDQAKMDEDGYFWYVGRSDDVIISSGYTIGPSEVEDALMKHAQVKECAAIASPDEVRGAVVKAFVVLKDMTMASEQLKTELQEHVKSITAPYKYPRKLEFVTSLPKTATGKVKRSELRRMEKQKKNV